MASDADKVRKDLIRRGYQVELPTKRGGTSYSVLKNGVLIARFPVNPSRGSWLANLEAGIRRYERGGAPPRSNRLAGRKS